MTIPTTTALPWFDGRTLPRLGMGCWAIGGPFFADGAALGYGAVDDAESRRAIAAALEAGVRHFDTAAVYGAGHSETLLGETLAGRDDVCIATKIGLAFDPARREVLGESAAPDAVAAAVEDSCRRLRRERIDLVYLHLNALPLDRAAALFDSLERLREAGRVRAFGWSTDFPERAAAMAGREGFVAVQHAANVLFSAPLLLPEIERLGLLSVNRSPLAMGVLGGRFRGGEAPAHDDVRASGASWLDWFEDGRVAPRHAATLETVRECLTTGGRTLAQGALGWLWARSPATLPIPGFRTVAQVRENAGALAHGALPASVMDEIESLVPRAGEETVRER